MDNTEIGLVILKQFKEILLNKGIKFDNTNFPEASNCLRIKKTNACIAFPWETDNDITFQITKHHIYVSISLSDPEYITKLLKLVNEYYDN